MDHPELTPAEAMDRFRRIYHALNQEPHWWEHAAWLRFAGQAAVLIPGDPSMVGHAIRDAAMALNENTSWMSIWRTPLRYVIAALLVQTEDDAHAFALEAERVRALYRDAHIRHGGIFEIISILILRLGMKRQPIPMARVQRLHEIYAGLKARHWWMTGPQDLPTCAFLTDMPKPAADIVAYVEELYHGMRALHFTASVHLETAAHILPLAELPSAMAVERYAALAQAFRAAGSTRSPIGYDAIAMLCLLDLEPGRVVATALETRRQLELVHPVPHEEIILDLVADMTYIELTAQDRSLEGRGRAGNPALYHHLIETGRKAAIVLACFGATAVDPSTF